MKNANDVLLDIMSRIEWTVPNLSGQVFLKDLISRDEKNAFLLEALTYADVTKLTKEGAKQYTLEDVEDLSKYEKIDLFAAACSIEPKIVSKDWLEFRAPRVLNALKVDQATKMLNGFQQKFSTVLSRNFVGTDDFNQNFFIPYQKQTNMSKHNSELIMQFVWEKFALNRETFFNYKGTLTEKINDIVNISNIIDEIEKNEKNNEQKDTDDLYERAWDSIEYVKNHRDVFDNRFSQYENLLEFYENTFPSWKKRIKSQAQKSAMRTFNATIENIRRKVEDKNLSDDMKVLIDNASIIPRTVFGWRSEYKFLYTNPSSKTKEELEESFRIFLVLGNDREVDSTVKNLVEKFRRYEEIAKGPQIKDLIARFQKLNSKKNKDYSDLTEREEKLVERYKNLSGIEIAVMLEKMQDDIPDIIEGIEKIKYTPIKPEAPKSAPLEKFAFGAQRKKSGITEPNTEFEDELFRALRSHILNNEHMNVKYVEAIKGFIQNGHYKTIFRTPKNKYAFRGMSSIPGNLFEVINKQRKQNQTQGELKLEFNFASNQGEGRASSWSASARVAFESFSNSERGSCVLIAEVRDPRNNFMTGDFYELSEDLKGFKNEKEFIALGNVRCFYILWKTYGEWKYEEFSEEVQKIITNSQGSIK